MFYIAGDSFVAAHNYAFSMTYVLYREDWEAGGGCLQVRALAPQARDSGLIF